ncbi:MAG: hypothetical protein E7031_00595 [Akkermansiaceae bacterium]|nr:hypothetical protein [Akkermansiaceae bacterium]
MNRKSLLFLPFMAMQTLAEDAPEFSVSQVIFAPPPPPGEESYLREDEESGAFMPQLRVAVTAVLYPSQKEEETTPPDIYDIVFNGELIAPDKKPLYADVFAYSEDDSITIVFEYKTISKIHPVYTLKGTLEFNTADDENNKSNEQHHKYTINQKIRIVGP